MLDEEAELEGWMARNNAIAMAKMVAAIHHTLIPSLFTSIPPFHTIVKLDGVRICLIDKAILIPEHIGGAFCVKFNIYVNRLAIYAKTGLYEKLWSFEYKRTIGVSFNSHVSEK
jgi:hypothetical protein